VTTPPAPDDSIPFTDAHVHFWDHSLPGVRWRFLESDFDHPRLKGTQRLDAPRYSSEEFLSEAGEQAPSKLIHVQCAMATPDPIQETMWLASMAEATGFPTAIVAGCQLRQADAGDVLLANASASSLVRGVRDLTISGGVDASEVRSAFDAAAEVNASVELMLPLEHYGSVARLAGEWPAVTIVLGHAGQPLERDEAYFDRWTAALATLADRVPNVVLKVSAIASSADPQWTTESIRPWVLGAVQSFTARRCMLASNWPIDRLYGTYPRLIGAYREIIGVLPEHDQRAVLHETADRLYGVSDAACGSDL
jgi:predicted TIM-barrel fold metal-dependent hydrolase